MVVLNYEFARRIKARNPNVITVFGGPNYPVEKDEQREMLESRRRTSRSIDIYRSAFH